MTAPTDLPSYRSQPEGGSAPSSRPMIVTTTENIPEARVVKTLGQVFGLTVRSRSLGGNIAATLKSLVGGEIRSYVKLNEDARRLRSCRGQRRAPRPHGAKRRRHGGQCSDHDALRFHRDVAEHERDRGLRYRPGRRVAARPP